MPIPPKVSVLIPTYNNASFLDETIQSVLNQTFQDFELIIVDNCSTDNTEEVVEKYLSDDRISYYKNSTNLGLSGNWNKCLEYAKGEYIKYLCSDDKFLPELLEKYVAVMDAHPQVSIVTSNRETFGKGVQFREVPFYYVQEGRKIIYKTLETFNWIGEPTLVMFRKSNLYIGPFRKLIFITDMEMWLRQLTVGDCYFLPETLCQVRTHPNQVTTMATKNFINYFEEYELCKAIKERNGYDIDFSGLNMDKVLEQKALKCAKAMYLVMPKLYKKNSRKVFLKALKIAVSEKVLFDSFYKIFNSKRKRSSSSGVKGQVMLANK
jgi:glycosyltransferase involved in cell wall biosynthesis